MKYPILTIVLLLQAAISVAQVGPPNRYMLLTMTGSTSCNGAGENGQGYGRITVKKSDGTLTTVSDGVTYFDNPISAITMVVQGSYSNTNTNIYCSTNCVDTYTPDGLNYYFQGGGCPNSCAFICRSLPYATARLLPVIMIGNKDRSDPADNGYCENQIVNLQMTYHGGNASAVAWQYRIGPSGIFKPLVLPGYPSSGVVAGSVSFTMQDLLGSNYSAYLNKKIQIRAAAANAYNNNNSVIQSPDEGSNILEYNFYPLAPVAESITPVPPDCPGGTSNKMTIHFNRALLPTEIITALTIARNGAPDFDQHGTISVFDSNNNFTWENISPMVSGANIYSLIVEGKFTGGGSLTCNRTPVAFNIPVRLPVTYTTTANNVTCFGAGNGSITLNASGGTGTYTYSKDNGVTWQTGKTFTGLSAGTYNVIAKDINGCPAPAAQPVTITAPLQALGVSVDIYDDPKGAATNDGWVNVKVNGGTTPYTYSWSNGATTQNISGVGGGTYTLVVTDKNGCTANVTTSLVAPPPIVINITETGISCNGVADGALKATVSGGVPPYRYSWSNGEITTQIDHLLAGRYTFTVTDANNVIETSAYNLLQPAVLKVTPSATITTCYNSTDGTVNSVVTGGTAPYSYQWNNGFVTTGQTGIPAGKYVITITDAHTCIAKDSINVPQPDSILSHGVITTPTRNGSTDGAITTAVRGGTGPYTYAWSTGNNTSSLQNLGHSIHTLIIRDKNNCFGHDTFNVVEPDILRLTMDMRVPIACHGLPTGILDAVVTGGVQPYTYTWLSGAYTASLNNLTPGTYAVRVTDKSGVIVNGSYTVTEPPLLQLQLTSTEVSCGEESDGTVTSLTTGGVTPYTYQWSNGAATANITQLNGGMYTLHVTDANGCILSQSSYVTAPGQLMAEATVKPPVCYGYNDGAIDLHVSGGRLPYTFAWSSGAVTEDVSALTAGVYKVNITDSSGCLIRREYTLQQPEKLLVDLGRDRTLCVGQSVELNGTILRGIQYAWHNNKGYDARMPVITVNEAAVYDVIATDPDGCMAKDTVQIKRDEREIDASFIVSTQSYTGESVVAVNISQPEADSTLWILPAAAKVLSSSRVMTELTFTKPGVYTIYMTSYRGDCEITTERDVMVVDAVNLPDVNSNYVSFFKRAAIRPNPNNGQFTVDVEVTEDITVNYRFFDVQRNLLVYERKGQLTKDVLINEKFDVQGLPAGVYVLLIESARDKKALKVIIL